MGLVFRAIDTRSGQVVALKLLAPELSGEPQWQRRFLREAAALRTLNHPGIVKLFESGEHEGFSFFTMELIEGETLAQRLKREKPSIADAVSWTKEILNALSAAHKAGFLHGDLKPQNIMLDSYGRIRLLDFGLTRTLAANLPATQTASAVTGTVEYLSPERIAGATPDERSDLFSIGVLLYEFFSGHTPFARSNPLATAAAILHESPQPLPQTVPPALASVVRHCLEKEVPLRPPSASALAAELEQAYWERESFAARHKWLLTATAVTLAVFVILLFRNASSPSVVDLTVPSTGDIWLAGQPNGTRVVGLYGSDSVPTNAPVALAAKPGHILTFAARGSVSVDGSCYGGSPDGGCYNDETPFGAGPAHGISSYVGPASALVGVFLDLHHPSPRPPAPLDFRAKTNFSALSPALGQIYFIGDGLTGTAKGARQRFTVPARRHASFSHCLRFAWVEFREPRQLPRPSGRHRPRKVKFFFLPVSHSPARLYLLL